MAYRSNQVTDVSMASPAANMMAELEGSPPPISYDPETSAAEGGYGQQQQPVGSTSPIHVPVVQGQVIASGVQVVAPPAPTYQTSQPQQYGAPASDPSATATAPGDDPNAKTYAAPQAFAGMIKPTDLEGWWVGLVCVVVPWVGNLQYILLFFQV